MMTRPSIRLIEIHVKTGRRTCWGAIPGETRVVS